MLTITPPETRVDEIQVDETERDSILLKLSPTRVKAKRKARNAHGFNYIQLIVGMIIFVALSRIVGPPAFRMITRARSTALNANIQTAAETVRNVLAIDPAKRGTVTATTGVPDAIFIAALTDDAPFNWQTGWRLDADDDSDTIRVQFIDQSASATPSAAIANTDAPDVRWLLNDWDAVRIQAKNQDNAWACALIVLKPDSNNLDADGDELVSEAGTDDAATGFNVAVDLANAHLRGIWYDSGDTYITDTSNRAHSGTDHCSPVVYDATTPTAPLPGSASGWTIDAATLTRNA